MASLKYTVDTELTEGSDSACDREDHQLALEFTLTKEDGQLARTSLQIDATQLRDLAVTEEENWLLQLN